MDILAALAVGALIVGALLICIFKGSRPPQPIPSTATPTKKAAIAAFAPVLCALTAYATFNGVELYTRTHLEPPKPLLILFLGIIVPWLAGLYFSYVCARAANRLLRAVGALEMLAFLLAGGLVLIAR